MVFELQVRRALVATDKKLVPQIQESACRVETCHKSCRLRCEAFLVNCRNSAIVAVRRSGFGILFESCITRHPDSASRYRRRAAASTSASAFRAPQDRADEVRSKGERRRMADNLAVENI